MDVFLRMLKESNRRVDSYSAMIVACTFFPTTFLEIAVFSHFLDRIGSQLAYFLKYVFNLSKPSGVCRR